MIYLFFWLLSNFNCKIEQRAIEFINKIRSDRGVPPIQENKALKKAAKINVKRVTELEYPTIVDADWEGGPMRRIVDSGYTNPSRLDEISLFGSIDEYEKIIDQLQFETGHGESIWTMYDDVGVASKKKNNRRYWDFVFGNQE